MPNRPYRFNVAEQRRTRGAGKRGPLTGVLLDRGFVQHSWGAAGARGDGPFARAWDQVIAIEEGRMGFVIDGEEFELGPGEAIYMPPGADRLAWSITDTRKVEIFGARRWDRWEFANHQLRIDDPDWAAE